MKLSAVCLSLALILAGCGSHQDGPTVPQDQTLQRYQRAGQSAYDLGRPEEAINQYRLALTQAEARDDLTAIGNLSFNLAATQLRANQPTDALATARAARAELARRGAAPLSALDLVEATALYRTGDAKDADGLAEKLQGGSDKDIAAAASFLRGLIADDRHDGAALAAASQMLQRNMSAASTASTTGTAAPKPEQQADATELTARLNRLQGDFASAKMQALRVADMRRDLLDYRGLARALSVAADAARQAKDPAAADLYLRAGRSAAAQGDRKAAQNWLNEALRLSNDPAVTEAAHQAINEMKDASTP